MQLIGTLGVFPDDAKLTVPADATVTIMVEEGGEMKEVRLRIVPLREGDEATLIAHARLRERALVVPFEEKGTDDDIPF